MVKTEGYMRTRCDELGITGDARNTAFNMARMDLTDREVDILLKDPAVLVRGRNFLLGNKDKRVILEWVRAREGRWTLVRSFSGRRYGEYHFRETEETRQWITRTTALWQVETEFKRKGWARDVVCGFKTAELAMEEANRIREHEQS
jgi:hypothetical protein